MAVGPGFDNSVRKASLSARGKAIEDLALIMQGISSNTCYRTHCKEGRAPGTHRNTAALLMRRTSLFSTRSAPDSILTQRACLELVAVGLLARSGSVHIRTFCEPLARAFRRELGEHGRRDGRSADKSCVGAAREGADFPTVWQSVLIMRHHLLVVGPPI